MSINKKKSAATTAAPAKLWSAHAWATYAGLAISGAVMCCYLRIIATVQQAGTGDCPCRSARVDTL